MWEYTPTPSPDELYHYGVKGMRWGVRNRRELKVAKKFAKAGRKQGEADFYRKEGDVAYKKHMGTVNALNKTAKRLESEGKYLRAEATRKAASSIKSRGENIRANNYAHAERYIKQSQKLNEKATKYATKKKVNLGKKTLDSILSESKTKGFNWQSQLKDLNTRYEVEKVAGSKGVSVYEFTTGR